MSRARCTRSQTATPAGPAGWWLYLLECADGTWYAGISTDVDARLAAHAAGTGARYTRGRGPLRLLATRAYPDRASASRAEWQLKRLPKRRKLGFFAVAGYPVQVSPHCPGPSADADVDAARPQRRGRMPGTQHGTPRRAAQA